MVYAKPHRGNVTQYIWIILYVHVSQEIIQTSIYLVFKGLLVY